MTDSPPFECGPRVPSPDHHGRGPRPSASTPPARWSITCAPRHLRASCTRPHAPRPPQAAAARPSTGPPPDRSRLSWATASTTPPVRPEIPWSGRARPTPKRRQPPTRPPTTSAWTSSAPEPEPEAGAVTGAAAETGFSADGPANPLYGDWTGGRTAHEADRTTPPRRYGTPEPTRSAGSSEPGEAYIPPLGPREIDAAYRRRRRGTMPQLAAGGTRPGGRLMSAAQRTAG